MNESSTPTPYKYAPTVPLFHSADGVCSYILAPHAADHTWLHIPFWPNEKWSALWTNGERTHVDKMSTRLLVTKSIAILCIFKGRSMVQNERRTWTSAVCIYCRYQRRKDEIKRQRPTDRRVDVFKYLAAAPMHVFPSALNYCRPIC